MLKGLSNAVLSNFSTDQLVMEFTEIEELKRKTEKRKRGMDEQSWTRLTQIARGKTRKTLFPFQLTAHTYTPLNGIHLGTVS